MNGDIVEAKWKKGGTNSHRNVFDVSASETSGEHPP